MKIRSGGKELLESLSFMALGLGETELELTKDQETLRFVFDFIEEPGADQSMQWTVLNENGLKVSLTNWNNALGTTLLEPVEVGLFQGRKLFFMFHVKKAGSKNQLREITFSAYLGEEVPNGKD